MVDCRESPHHRPKEPFEGRRSYVCPKQIRPRQFLGKDSTRQLPWALFSRSHHTVPRDYPRKTASYHNTKGVSTNLKTPTLLFFLCKVPPQSKHHYATLPAVTAWHPWSMIFVLQGRMKKCCSLASPSLLPRKGVDVM